MAIKKFRYKVFGQSASLLGAAARFPFQKNIDKNWQRALQFWYAPASGWAWIASRISSPHRTTDFLAGLPCAIHKRQCPTLEPLWP